MSSDAEYLKALADELMCPNMEADLDKEDGQRLYRIADAHDKLVAERDRLVAGLKLAMEWLDSVCDPECYDLRTPEGVAVHAKLVALLKET